MMDTRGLVVGGSSADVELVERIFQRIMSEGPVLSGRGRSRGTGVNKQVLSFPNTIGQRQLTSPALATRRNVENRSPYRQASAGPLAKRQIAIDCGLKSFSVNGRCTQKSTPLSVSMDIRNSSQASIYLEAPDGHVTPRKGLSGSKVRPPSQPPSSRPQSGAQPGGDNYSNNSGASSPTPRPVKKSQINYAILVDEDESEHGLIGSYKWNSSNQGRRLQTHLTGVTSGRAMKRASEMIHHRLDPMYLMSGNRLSLQNRYDVDEHEMQRLREMTQMREDLMSDLKKMKYPYGIKAVPIVPKKVTPSSKTAFNTPRDASPKRKEKMSDNKQNKQRVASASSEPPLNKIEEHSDSGASDQEDQ